MNEVGESNALLGEWSSVPLGDLAEFVTSGSRNWSKYYADEGALFVRTQDIKHNCLSETGIPRVKLPEKAEGKRTRIHKGDLLITITGYIGRVAAIDKEVEEAYVSQSVALVRLRNPEYAKFIQYQLLARRAGVTQLEAMAYGLGRPVLNLDNIRNAQIKVAPLDQQKRIVAEIEKQFSRLDEAVANLKRVKANLKRYKAAVLKAAVEGRLVETEAERARREGRSYENGAQLLQRILETRRSQWQGKGKYKEPAAPDTTDLPELPEGWVWAALGQLVWSVKDGPHFSPKYSAEGIPFISGGNIRPEGIDFSSTKFISPKLHEEFSKRCKPEYGDLLYTKGGTTGVARVNTETREFNVWVHVAVLKLMDSIEPFYLQHALNSLHCYRQAQKYTHGVGNQDLGLTRMVWITVPLPSSAEQRRIVAEIDRRLSFICETEVQIDANLQRAERLRQSVLQRAFTAPSVGNASRVTQ